MPVSPHTVKIYSMISLFFEVDAICEYDKNQAVFYSNPQYPHLNLVDISDCEHSSLLLVTKLVLCEKTNVYMTIPAYSRITVREEGDFYCITATGSKIH